MKKIYFAPVAKAIALCEENMIAVSTVTGKGEGIEWGGEGEGKDADSNRRGLGGGMWDDM